MVITDELKMIITAEVERALKEMEAWDDQVDESGDHIEKMAKEADAHFSTMQKSLDKAANKMLIWTGIVGAAGGAGLKFAGDLESQKNTFENLTGSAEAAAQIFDDLSNISIKTPLEPAEVYEAGEALLTYQFAVSEVNDTFVMLGDVAKGKAELLDTVTTAYGRMHLKGKASMEELNMLTDAGIPILAQLAEQYGVTTDELFKMVSGGKVGFADIEEAFITMTSEGGQFFNMMENKSSELEGKWSTAMGALKMSSADAMQSFLPMAKDALDLVAKLATGFTELDEDAQAAIITLIGVTAGIGPVMKVTAQVLTLQTTLTTAGAAVSVLQVGLIGLGAAGVVAGIVFIVKRFKEAREEAQGLADDLYSISSGKDVQNIQAEILNAFAQIEELRMNSAMYDTEYFGPDEVDTVKQIAKEFGVASADVARLAVELGKGTDEIDKFISKAEEEEKIRDAMLQLAQSRIMVQQELLKQAEAAQAAAEAEEQAQKNILQTIKDQEAARVANVVELRIAAEKEYQSALQETLTYQQAGWIDNEEAVKRNLTAVEALIKTLAGDIEYDAGIFKGMENPLFETVGNKEVFNLKSFEEVKASLEEYNGKLEEGDKLLLELFELWAKLSAQIEGFADDEKSLFEDLYEQQIQQIADREAAELALAQAKGSYLNAEKEGEIEKAEIYAGMIEQLEQMLGIEEQLTEQTQTQIGWNIENSQAIKDFRTELREVLSLDNAAEGLYSIFSAMGEALREGGSASQAAGNAFWKFVSGLAGEISAASIAAGLRVIAEGGLAAIPIGLGLIALGGITGLAVGYASTSYTPSTDSYENYLSSSNTEESFDPNDYPDLMAMVFDSEQELRDARIQNIDDVVEYAKKKRDEEIDDLEQQYSEEFMILKDQWERNLLSTEDFKQQLNTLNTDHNSNVDAINAPVDAAEQAAADEAAAEDAAQKAAAALADAKNIKTAQLEFQLYNLNKRLEHFNPLEMLFKGGGIKDDIATLEYRILKVKASTTLAEVQAAKNGADFTTMGPQLLLVGDNPGGKERVQVTPMSSPNYNGPQESRGNTYIIQGDNYSIEDLYRKLKAAGNKVEFMGND